MNVHVSKVVILAIGLLTIQTPPLVHAQGRMGMMMARRGFGFGRFGGGIYADLYAPAYFYEDNSNSKKKQRNYRYEEPTLSPEEERERLHQMELAWSQGDLTGFESQTAMALNILLDDLRDLQSKGVQPPDTALDTESLGRVNVLVGRTNGNPGALKNNGRLNWPTVFQGQEFQSEREMITRLAPQVIEQARHGQVTDLARLDEAVKKLHQNLLAKIAIIPTTTYVRANRFLTQLDDAIRILRLPDAGNYFNEIYAARGSTAGELVRHMTRLDLHFAPPVEGDASAYRALHQVLAAYDRSAHEQMSTRSLSVRTR